MIWLLWKLISLPVRIVFGTASLSLRVGFVTGRLLGYRRLFVLAVGVAVGLLLAPVPGATLRAKLRERLGMEGTADVATRVRRELSQSPRTWHLPQPDIEVIGGRVVLRGEVPHEAGRDDLEAAVRAVHGVTHVDNRLEVRSS